MEIDTDAIVVANVNINWSQMNSLKFMGLATPLSLSIRTAFYPFNLVRTRLQNQDTKPLQTAYKIQMVKSNQGTMQHIKTPQVKGYRGMLDAVSKIYGRNGLRGFYDGFSVNSFSVIQNVMYIGVLEFTRERIELYFEGSKIFSQNTIKHKIAPMIGAMCATSTLILSVPTDVVSQYLQDAKSDGSKGTNIRLLHKIRHLQPNEKIVVHVIKDLWTVGGVRAFYKGFGATCTLSLFSGVFWPFYFSLKGGIFEKLSIDPHEKWTLYTICAVSLSAGMACCVSNLVSNPIELTRNQSQMHQQSAWKMLRIIWREEGMNMFIKGLTPRLGHSILHCIVGLPLLEHVKKWSVKKKNENL
ncbi:hypothetical protein LOTGIDRAFT_236880 [Lottia gigantea]|uniref:Solute carrier family 25 member 44 n=1 Tax=Lottia gigantea TaxID=225164 RepID=V3ZKL0_LOTGI|nr:hypothetical protein LOTGIDRAFT_236880 [Lottia gigantea]ESO82940.1 hypothetical protein LOTGIDRAFT_236880 [Lottia gigantea]